MSRLRLVFIVGAKDKSSLLPVFAAALQSEGYNTLFYHLFYSVTECGCLLSRKLRAEFV